MLTNPPRSLNRAPTDRLDALGIAVSYRLRPLQEIGGNPTCPGRVVEQSASREAPVNLLACIIVGIVAGWLAEKITGRNHGLIMNLIVGIVGASIGGFLASSLLGLHYAEGLNMATIAVATGGAVLLLAVLGGFQSRQGRPS